MNKQQLKELALKWIETNHLYIIGLLVLNYTAFLLGLLIGWIAVH